VAQNDMEKGKIMKQVQLQQ